jgi:hypothetical protein
MLMIIYAFIDIHIYKFYTICMCSGYVFRVVEGERAMQPGSREAFGVPLDLVDTSEVSGHFLLLML